MLSGKHQKGISAVIRYLKPHRRELTILAVLSMLSAVGSAAIPYLSGRLFDEIIRSASAGAAVSLKPLFLIIGIWLVSRLITDITEWFKQVRQERFSAALEADYMVNGLSKLLRFPLSFHKQQKTGEVIQRIQRAAGWMEQIINRVLIDLAPQFFSIGIAIIITFLIEPILAGILLIAVVIYIVILVRVAPQLSALSLKQHRAYSAAYGDSYDAVLNVQAVKQATAEGYQRRKIFKSFQLRAVRVWAAYIRISSNLNFSQRIIVTVTQGALFIVSIYMVRSGTLSVGELVAFNGYAAMLFGPFVILCRNWDAVQNGLVAVERAEEVLTRPEEEYVPKNAIILSDIQGAVEFRDVRFKYERKHKEVLRGISFTTRPGQSIALVGESGVGKTTLTDLISGYYRASRGKVFIDGRDVRRLDLTALRRQIAVVPQELLLFNDTVKNNIRYGQFGATDEEVKEAAIKAHADEFISAFPRQYNQKVGERGIKLSTGQKQRVAIARAILRAPRILILDEPTSALDAQSEKFIAESFEQLMKGRTTFIIAHRLSTVRKADMILVLEKGLIVESGTHEELVQKENGVYRRLYELQIGLK